MPLASERTIEPRRQHFRSGTRLNSRVRVAVEWNDVGRTMRAEGYTVDVGPKGCLVLVPQGFKIGQRLKLINLVNNKVSDAVLIWSGHEIRGAWELGLEMTNRPADFWEIDF